MPIPSGFKSKNEWNAYQREYRKKKKAEFEALKIRVKELEEAEKNVS